MDTVKEIRDFIVERFLFGEDGELQEDTSFMEAGIIDSTGVLELVGFLEEKFSIKVEDDELTPENLDSLKRVSQFVDKKQAMV